MSDLIVAYSVQEREGIMDRIKARCRVSVNGVTYPAWASGRLLDTVIVSTIPGQPMGDKRFFKSGELTPSYIAQFSWATADRISQEGGTFILG